MSLWGSPSLRVAKVDNPATGCLHAFMACATHICCVAAIKCRFIRFIVYVSRTLDNVPDHLERLGLPWSVYDVPGTDPAIALLVFGQAFAKRTQRPAVTPWPRALPVQPAPPGLYREALLGTGKPVIASMVFSVWTRKRREPGAESRP